MAGEPTKTCPHCHAEVPHFAIKCKHCFGDLTARPGGEPRRGVWGWVLLLVVMTVIGGATLASVFGTRTLAQVSVMESSQSVVLVWTGYDGQATTRRVPFQDIAKVELVTDADLFGQTSWEVFLVTQAGERVLINHSTTEDLQGYAESIIQPMRKPLIPINKVRIGTQVIGET